MSDKDRCPHCGWTPEEMNKLLTDRDELLAALRNMLEIAGAALAIVESRDGQ